VVARCQLEALWSCACGSGLVGERACREGRWVVLWAHQSSRDWPVGSV